MFKRLVLLFVISTVMLFSLLALAQGSPVVDPNQDPSGFFAQVLAAFHAKAWMLVGLLAVIGIVALLRKLGPASWFQGDRKGAIWAILIGILFTLAGSCINQGTLAHFTIAWLFNGIYLGIAAAGGYAVVKKLIAPSDVTAPAK